MVSAQSQVRRPERHGPSDPNEFHFAPHLAAGEPSIDVQPRQDYFGNGGFSRNRQSVGREVFRVIVYGLIIIAIAGLPLAWQFSDDNTKDVVKAWGNAWGISPSKWSSVLGTAKSPSVGAQTVSETSDQASTQETSGQRAGVTPAAPASVAAGPSPELQDELEALVSDLAVVRRLVEQLAAKQGQMAQELTTLQSTQQDISQKLSSVSQSTTVQVPQHKNAPRPMPAGAPLQSSSVPMPAARPREPLPLH